MKKKFIKFLCLPMLFSAGSFAQRNCSTMENLARITAQHPEMIQKMQNIEEHTNNFISSADNFRTAGTIYNIPVVVHVVYNTTSQNISDAQIQSQINVLNQDFRRLNADKVNTPSAFSTVVADAEISFCLATVDPNGNPTTGIIRKSTTVTSFSDNDAVKSSTTGGSNAWPSDKYLNLWICNLGGGLLGYAQFPGGPASTDGVVMGYTCTGTSGTATAPFNKGRTATHEIGHWLNLRHIWGDASCGSDLVTDTPTQQTSNYNCPSHPHVTCSNTGDMFMNYMDYVDDNCMNSFTTGQKTRMRALFAAGGARASLLTSPGCGTTSTTTCSVPASLAASSITTTSATLSWGSTGATSYNIKYKATASTTWLTTTSTTNSKSLTGLVAGSSYEFQVQSVCGTTSSLYSASKVFTTLTSGTSSTTSTLVIGNGTVASPNAPYGTYYMDEKCQFIITKAELVAAGYTSANNSIKSMAFNVYSASTQVMNGFSIKLRHTTNTAFTSTSFLANTNMVTVYSGAKTAVAGWNTHTFTTPFAYNGVDNILVEICWDNSTYTTDTKVYATSLTTYNSLYKKVDIATGGACANTTGTLAYERPNIKFVLGPAAMTGRFEPTMEEEVVLMPETEKISFNLYPNPVNNVLNLDYQLTNDNSTVIVTIFNLMGDVIKKVEFNSQNSGDHSVKFDMNESTQSLSNGIYMCSLNVNGNIQTQRFVLNK